LSHEYAYTYERTHTQRLSWLQNWYCRLKLYLYQKLETSLYTKKDVPACQFEAVSPALRDHLIKTYDMNPSAVTIACDDIPQPISIQKRKQWRIKTRTLLGIPSDVHLYCYNGSAKPWQLSDLFFSFCQDTIAADAKAHLLIISQDIEQYKKLIPVTHIPAERCHFICTEQNMLYQYLCAADTGLAFRDATLLNWVARPTKLLEYQAVGLRILHNGTIAWVAESARNQHCYVPRSAPISEQRRAADRHVQNR
jgi:hypothetical protein